MRIIKGLEFAYVFEIEPNSVNPDEQSTHAHAHKERVMKKTAIKMFDTTTRLCLLIFPLCLCCRGNSKRCSAELSESGGAKESESRKTKKKRKRERKGRMDGKKEREKEKGMTESKKYIKIVQSSSDTGRKKESKGYWKAKQRNKQKEEERERKKKRLPASLVFFT